MPLIDTSAGLALACGADASCELISLCACAHAHAMRLAHASSSRTEWHGQRRLANMTGSVRRHEHTGGIVRMHAGEQL